MKGNYGKRFLSLMLSVIMVLGMMPTGVLAAEYDYEIGAEVVTNDKNAGPSGNIPKGTEWVQTKAVEPSDVDILGEKISYSSVCGYNAHTHEESCFSNLTCHTHTQDCASNWKKAGLFDGCSSTLCNGHAAHYTTGSGWSKTYYYTTNLDKCDHDHIAEGCFVGKLGDTTACKVRTSNTGEEHTHDATCSEYTWVLKCLHENMTETPAADMTCTDAGTKGYWTCGTCDGVFADAEAKTETTVEAQMIPAAHTEAEAVIENTVAPTCDVDGSHDEVVYCSVCEDELSRKTVTDGMIGHDYEYEADNNDTHHAVCKNDAAHVIVNEAHDYDANYYCAICDYTKQHTITWVVDGVEYDAKPYDYNSKVTALAPTNPGFAFDGWYDAANNKIDFATFVVTGDIELHGSFVKSAAKIGEAIYESLGDAITAAKAGDTIILMADITEDVTVNKAVTIDGAEKNYTGTMSIGKVSVTIENVNFVGGRISKAKQSSNTNVTIRNCDFDGQGMSFYAVDLRNTNNVVIENVTAKNYGYGFLQIPNSNASLSVKNAEISDVNYGFKVDYNTNGVTMENVKINAESYAIYASNYSVRTYTITDCTFEAGKAAIGLWDRNGTLVDTFKFVGDNTVVGKLLYIGGTGTVAVKIDLSADNALSIDSVTAEDQSSSVYYKIIKEENEVYTIVKLQKEAKIGDVYYMTLAEALDARQIGETIEVVLDGVDLSIVPDNLEITDGKFITDKTFTIKVKGEGTIEVTGAEEVDTVIEAAGVKTYVLKEEEITIKAAPVVNDGVSATYVVSIGGAELTYGEGYAATATLSVANGQTIEVTFEAVPVINDTDVVVDYNFYTQEIPYSEIYNAVISSPEIHEDAAVKYEYFARPAMKHTVSINALDLDASIKTLLSTLKINEFSFDMPELWMPLDAKIEESVSLETAVSTYLTKDRINGLLDIYNAAYNAYIEEHGEGILNTIAAVAAGGAAVAKDIEAIKDAVYASANYYGAHNFGYNADGAETVVEKIRITYTSPAMNWSTEANVTLKDPREAAFINPSDLTLVYRDYTDEDILSYFELVDKDGNPIDGTLYSTELTDPYTFEGKNVSEAGYVLTIKFAGNETYRAAEKAVTFRAEKAALSIDLPNITTTYGENYIHTPVVNMGNKYGVAQEVIDSLVEIIIGLDGNEFTVTEDGKLDGIGTHIQIKLPKDETLATIFKSLGLDVYSEEGETLSLTELQEYIDKLGGALEGFDPNNETAAGINNILQGLTGIVDLNNVKITFGGGYPTDIGAYLYGAVSTNPNYETAYDVAYLLIAPKTEQVELKWNYTDDNGVFTAQLIEILGHEGMGATAYKADGETLSKEMVHDVFFGFDKEGKFVTALDVGNRTELSTGAYAQIAFTIEIGNELYYAVPIVRPVVIVPGTAKVEIQGKDDNGIIVKTFDNTSDAMDAVVTVNGEVVEPKDGELTYNYVGLQTNAQPYNDTVAPVHAGAYLVTATYKANGANGDLAAIGVDVATLVIKPAETTIVVNDLTKNAGESVNIKSEMVKVETATGQNPDTTVVTGTVKVGGDFLTNGWADVTGEVNVDFPVWVDTVLKQYVPGMYNGLKASDFTAKVIGKIPAIEAKLEAMLAENGMEADLSKYMSVVNKVLTEVQAIAADLPADVILTFNDTDVEDTLTSGVYGVAAIVTDSDHMPSADIGLLTVGLSDKLVVDILNTTVHYNGEAQMPNIKATIDGVETTTDLDLMIIVDKTNGIANIIADEEIQKLLDLIEEKTGLKLADGVELKALIEAVDSFVKAMKDNTLVAKIEALFEVDASSVLSKLDGALRAAAAQAEDAKIVMNGSKPVDAGTYQVMALAVANGFMPEVTQGTLTITPHVEGEVVVENEKAPTCTEDGSYDNVTYCTVEGCGIEMSRETVTVPSEGHKAGEVVVENEKAATCTEAGSYDNVTYCTVCGTELSRETMTVDALEHDWDDGVITTQPTVDAAGVKTYTCKNDANHTYTEEVPKLTAVAAIGTQGYATLSDAIAAAKSGDTIVFLKDITENVTVNKAVTIDGAEKNYTGTMSVVKVNVTIENVNFVQGNVSKPKSTSANLTIRNCDFDGQGMNTYAVNLTQTNNVVIENVTAKNYGYGFLQQAKANVSLNIKNVTVSNMNYGFKVDYSNGVTMENVKVSDVKYYGIYDSNYGTKTYTLTNCDFSSIEIWEREGKDNVATFNFVGANKVDVLANSAYAKYVLSVEDATLAAPADQPVESGVEDFVVAYENGIYKLVKVEYVAQIEGTDKKFETLQAAIDAAQNGETVVLLKDIELNEDDVVMTSKNYTALASVEGKSITLDMNGKTITADYDSSTALYAVVYVGDGADLTVTGEGKIDLTTGDTKAGEYDCVYYMFWKHGTTGSLTVENGTFHANNVEDSMVYANATGTTVVNGGTWTLDTVGTETNGFPSIFNASGKNGNSITVTGGTYNYDIAQQYWALEVNIPEDKAVKNNGDGTWSVVGEVVAAVVEKNPDRVVRYASLADAVNAAEDGETVIVLADHEIACDVDPLIKVAGKAITIDLNGKEITANATTNTTRIIFETAADAGLTMIDSVGEGSVVAKGDGLYYMFRNGGTMVIEGGSYTLSGLKGGAMFYSMNDGMTVTGGNFTQLTEGWMFNTEGNSDHVITVSGGTYNRYFIGGKTVTPEENTRGEVVLAEGHILADNDTTPDTWTVVEGVVAMIEHADGTHDYYATAADALADAKGETVIMLLNSTEDIRYFIIDADDTLDLNGKTVTVNSEYFMNFGNVIDGDGTTTLGALKLNSSNIMWDVSNAQLPVKTPDGEYKFVKIIGFNEAVVGGNKYVFQPLFTPAAHKLLLEGEAVTGVSIEAHVAWTKDSDFADSGVQKFVFKDEIVEKFVNSYKASTGKYGQMFTLTLKGTEGFTSLEVSAVVASETGVSFSAEIN